MRSLAEIPEPVDMVDIFRASQYALGIVKEAIAMNPQPKVIWMQLGVQNAEAAALAEANGHEGGDEPLPQDRIRPAVVGDCLDGRQHPHTHLSAAPRSSAAAFSAWRSTAPPLPAVTTPDADRAYRESDGGHDNAR